MGASCLQRLVMDERHIDAVAFYKEYYGHKVEHLKILQNHFPRSRYRVWLAGDSSLDSKFYQPETLRHSAVNGYDEVLVPPLSRRDVSYWLNRADDLVPMPVTLNCAVEESTLRYRQSKLYPQDVFIRDNIREDDVLVVSVGGNDVALRPSLLTVWNALKGVFLNTETSLQTSPENSWGMKHFSYLFGHETQAYIEKLVAVRKPRRVIVCMLYFLDENQHSDSWASTTLSVLGYNSDPGRLQSFIRALYECATKRIRVAGTEVIPCPLYTAMNGKDSSLYVARVEPSEYGARALADLIARCMRQ